MKNNNGNKKRNNKKGDCLPPALEGFVGTDYNEALAEDVVHNTTHESPPKLKSAEEKVFRAALKALNSTGINYAVGAAFARNLYTGIWRHTKDLDVFLTPSNLKAAMDSLTKAGFEVHVEFDHWLAQAFKGGYQVDLIFGTGHGQIPVDDSWFEYGQEGKVTGVNTRLIPIEEMIASAMFVAERRRFDGSDVVHLIEAVEGDLDWERILRRLGDHRQLLLVHLLLFNYIYPGHPDYLPQKLMQKLFKEAQKQWAAEDEDPKAFRGILLDPFSFSVDITDWGYEDRRKLNPLVNQEGELIL